MNVSNFSICWTVEGLLSDYYIQKCNECSIGFEGCPLGRFVTVYAADDKSIQLSIAELEIFGNELFHSNFHICIYFNSII